MLAALLEDPQGVPWRALASGTPKALADAIRYPFKGLGIRVAWRAPASGTPKALAETIRYPS